MENDLQHYGVPGMKWGVRRAQKKAKIGKARNHRNERLEKNESVINKAGEKYNSSRKQQKSEFKKAKTEFQNSKQAYKSAKKKYKNKTLDTNKEFGKAAGRYMEKYENIRMDYKNDKRLIKSGAL